MVILIAKMIFYGNHGDTDEFPPPRTQARSWWFEDFDDYWMILIAKMVIDGIIFDIHCDTDGDDAQASLEIALSHT